MKCAVWKARSAGVAKFKTDRDTMKGECTTNGFHGVDMRDTRIFFFLAFFSSFDETQAH